MEQLNVITLLDGFAQSLHWMEEDLKLAEGNGYILIIIDIKQNQMKANVFPKDSSEEAEAEYIEAEKEATSNKEIVVAMVATPNINDIKSAYPNYFADSTEFVMMLNLVTGAFLDTQKHMKKLGKYI